MTEHKTANRSTAAPAAVAGAAPPATLQAVLAQVAGERRAIYDRVREDLDLLEQAAAWELLYNPPEHDDELFALADRLLGIVEVIPRRIAELLAALKAKSGTAQRPGLEDAEFYLNGVHRMIGGELGRLRREVEKLRAQAAAGPLQPKSRALVCELAADLKGKYTSALMGATAAIVAEGIWNSVLLEPILFPEKAMEFRRNEELLAALRAVLETIDDLRREVPFKHLLERWRTATRVDDYALADLSSLRGKIAQLLKIQNRRALYSGDYHHIRRREQQLSRRLNELESLHQATWDDDVARVDAAVFARLQQLTIEICALLDMGLLAELLGESQVAALRAQAASQGEQSEEVLKLDDTAAWTAINPSSTGEYGFLIPLLSREDFKTFFEVLVSAVQRRASITAARSNVLKEAPPLADPVESPPIAEVIEPIGEAPLQLSPKSAGQALPEERLVALRRLEGLLQHLQSRDNPNWAAMHMVKRVLDRHGRIPPTMMKQAVPFLEQLLSTLLPELEGAAASHLIPAEIVDDLRQQCQSLTQPQPTPREIVSVVPVLFENLERTLQNLSWLVEQVIARRLG